MKTMQKTIALSITVLFSGFAFSQTNLGLKTTTQAATVKCASAKTAPALLHANAPSVTAATHAVAKKPKPFRCCGTAL